MKRFLFDKFVAKLSIISIVVLLILHFKTRNFPTNQNILGDARIPGIGIRTFYVDTVIRKLENPTLISYTTTLLISESGSGNELDLYFNKTKENLDEFGSHQSIITIKTLLVIRKLIFFSTNEINRKLMEYDLMGKCFTYWANPLHIQKVQELGMYGLSEKWFKIQFRIEPGHLPFEALIKQNLDYLNKPFNVGIQNELELISARILDPQHASSNCINNDFEWFRLNPVCLCRWNILNTDILIGKTNEVRNRRNMIDSELQLWPPNAPMLITNYISYGNQNLYIISPKNIYQRFCNPNIQILVMIHSAREYFEKRLAIRETYGNNSQLQLHNVGLLFFLGMGPVNANEADIMQNLTKEIVEFDDIVLIDIMDHYQNLTLKHMSVFNWVHTFCRTKERYPSWILKGDDDMLINIEVAVEIARPNKNIPLLGYLRSGDSPRRRETDPEFKKWTIPRYIFAPDSFPTYFPGFCYMIQTKWIPKYLQASLTTPIFHLDDAYVTGLLSLEVGICPTNFPTRITIYNDKSSCQLQQTISSKTHSDIDMKDQWESLNSFNVDCRQNLEPNITDPIAKGGCAFSPICHHFPCIFC